MESCVSYSILGHDSIVSTRVTTLSLSSTATNALRTLIGTIDQDWCTEKNPYKVVIAAGTYAEIQISPVDYLTIQGAGISSTIIVSDGLREDVDPVSGQAYNVMAFNDKHGIFGKQNIALAGLTWRVNDVKYCVHADSGAVAGYTMSCSSCRFEHSNGYPVGMGCYAGQTHSFNSCEFEKLGNNEDQGTVGSHGAFWHNANAQASAANLTLTDCMFENCGVVVLPEQDSGQTDIVTVTDCTTDDEGTNKGIYITASGSGLAYCINITQNDGTMPAFGFDAVNRPNAASYYTLVP